MSERLLILAAVFIAASVGITLLRLWQLRKLRVLQSNFTPTSAPEFLAVSGPALLYFATDDCAQCRFQQRPILEQLSVAAAIPVVTVDAIEREDLARHFGIMTVPSTVVLDEQRAPVAINHGVAPLQKLQLQVSALTSKR